MEDERVTVVLPDMFRCFVVQDPRVNTEYPTAKVKSEEWLTE
jgi:hypothetical protein